ncbi:NAD-binding protein [bacterium]|nr:NAD-binding protein [bacterium]RQV98098.1 MAG: TrkA family potassium uptake protein [bacterium]
MNIMIIGAYQSVYYLCRLFLSKGYKVTVINRNQEECERLAHNLKATIVHGDGSDPQILEEAGANSADAILAITPNDQDNLLICQLGFSHFHIPRTLAVVNDPDNEHVFRKLGVAAVSLTRVLSMLIEQQTDFDDITNLFSIGEGKINVTEVVLSTSSRAVGKTVQQIGMPNGSLIASILRQNKPIVPSGSTQLLDKDRLIVVTLPENHGEVLKILTSDQI